MAEGRFSDRVGARPQVSRLIHDDAPATFRAAVLSAAEQSGIEAFEAKKVVNRVLRRMPGAFNAVDILVWKEVQAALSDCQWYDVFDAAEAIYEAAIDPMGMEKRIGVRPDNPIGAVRAGEFERFVNDAAQDLGIGWKMESGRFVSREEEPVESVARAAESATEDAGHATALRELREARDDLSRRPTPDLTGAVQHCMAALELVAKSCSGEEKLTLGEIVTRHAKNLGIPKPLDGAIHKIWGFANNTGRHLSEGREPSRRDAALLLGLASSVIVYLLEAPDVQGGD